MTQSVFGQTDALALQVAAILTAEPSGFFAVPITAQRRFLRRLQLASGDVNAAIPATADGKAWVDVFPGRQHEVRIGGGATPVFEGTYAVHVCLMQRVGADEAQCALLAQTIGQIVQAFKGVSVTCSAAVQPFKAVLLDVDTPQGGASYDMDKLEEIGGCFVSEFILTFKVAV